MGPLSVFLLDPLVEMTFHFVAKKTNEGSNTILIKTDRGPPLRNVFFPALHRRACPNVF